MAETNPDSALLEQWARRFTRAFNDNDLDTVMGWFADDAVYDQFDDAQAKGRDEIRKAFEPQFAGAFGKMQFDEEDLFVDPARRKVMILALQARDAAGGGGLAGARPVALRQRRSGHAQAHLRQGSGAEARPGGLTRPRATSSSASRPRRDPA
jgi:ketosteroid isomerase-like protein